VSDIGSPVAIPERLLNRPVNLGKRPNVPSKAKEARLAGGLTRKVKAAIDSMIWEAMKRAEAATAAGIADVTLRQALLKPMVMRYYNEQLEVRRTSERPRNLSRLAEIRDQDVNLAAAVRAVQVLEQTAEGNRGGVTVNVAIAAGYVIDLSQDYGAQRSHEPQVSGVKPLIDNDDVGR
jgi:hypothetical protein